MIHTWVWDEATIQKHSHHMRSTIQIRGTTCTPYKHDCGYHLKLPRYMRPALIGQQAALEIAESWYTIATRREDSTLVLDIPNIEHIICTDAFCVGLEPASMLR